MLAYNAIGRKIVTTGRLSVIFIMFLSLQCGQPAPSHIAQSHRSGAWPEFTNLGYIENTANDHGNDDLQRGLLSSELHSDLETLGTHVFKSYSPRSDPHEIPWSRASSVDDDIFRDARQLRSSRSNTPWQYRSGVIDGSVPDRRRQLLQKRLKIRPRQSRTGFGGPQFSEQVRFRILNALRKFEEAKEYGPMLKFNYAPRRRIMNDPDSDEKGAALSIGLDIRTLTEMLATQRRNQSKFSGAHQKLINIG